MNNQITILVNAVVVKDNKILLSQRSSEEEHAPGKWTIPGGKVDFKEEVGILQETAKREVREEVGIEIKDEMKLLTNNTFQHLEDGEKVLAIVFFCYYKSGEIKALEDTIDVKWVKEEDIDKYQFHHQVVKNYVIKGFEEINKIWVRTKN